MNTPLPRWHESPSLPPGVDLHRSLGLFALVHLFGPSGWAVLIIAVQSGGRKDVLVVALIAWILPLIVAGAVLVAAARQAVPICRLISFTGYTLFRGFLLGFCYLGIALAYGSPAFLPSLCLGMAGVLLIELYAYLNARRFSDEKIIQLMNGSFSKPEADGRFQLLVHGPGLPEDDMWIGGAIHLRLLIGFCFLAPFLFALAITGRGDAMAGPIMLSLGLLLYFFSVGNWAGQHALRRAIKLRLAGKF